MLILRLVVLSIFIIYTKGFCCCFSRKLIHKCCFFLHETWTPKDRHDLYCRAWHVGYCAHTSLGCSVIIYNLYKRILLLFFDEFELLGVQKWWFVLYHWRPEWGWYVIWHFYVMWYSIMPAMLLTSPVQTECWARNGSTRSRVLATFKHQFLCQQQEKWRLYMCFHRCRQGPWCLFTLAPRQKESGILLLYTHPKAAVGRISIYTIKWVSGSLLLCVGLVGLFCSHLTIYECH